MNLYISKYKNRVRVEIVRHCQNFEFNNLKGFEKNDELIELIPKLFLA